MGGRIGGGPGVGPTGCGLANLSGVSDVLPSDVLPSDVLDEGPFFHGTKADLSVGDLLTAGFRSNYRPEVVMNHIYFTALPDGAGLAAELAAGEALPASISSSRLGGSRTTRTSRTRSSLATPPGLTAALSHSRSSVK